MRALVICFSLFVISAAALAQEPARPFEPVSGQDGKDVVWVPSSPDMVDKLMEIAKVTPADFVMDLGSGDGRNIIAAAKRGARGLGVEYNPEMVALSRRLATAAGVAEKAQFVEADMYGYDISKATVLAVFLLPVNMNRLAAKFFNLAPGSRVVSNTFSIDGWQPDYREMLPTNTECEHWCEALLWIVPAKIEGTWAMESGSIALKQDYQVVTGTLTDANGAQKLAGKLRGEEITFSAGGVSYKAIVNGNTMVGTAGDRPWRASLR
ncbi:MAG: class I SAM-dependent methyltransferase [Acidobacteriota bacterium]